MSMKGTAGQIEQRHMAAEASAFQDRGVLEEDCIIVGDKEGTTAAAADR